MRVRISKHAIRYIGLPPGGRTVLSPSEIVALIKSGSYVRFGEDQNTKFNLVWDHHKDDAVILLTKEDGLFGAKVVVSIWEAHYKLPVGSPSIEQVDSAKEKSEAHRSRMTL